MAEYLPVVKVQQRQYLIGSQKLSLSQRGTDCIVSLPSGDVTLEELKGVDEISCMDMEVLEFDDFVIIFV